MSELVFLTGLPRSGSTLLCNLLATHPDITVTPSSPLNQIMQNMKAQWSNDPFLLAQLDNDFDKTYERLKKATLSFMNTYSENKTKLTIDKNRGWLTNAEFVRHLKPDFKMIVCIRDLRGIFGSVEKQHKKTLLLNFPDNTETNDTNARANTLFANNGVIGSCIKALDNLNDIPAIMPHLFLFRFEDLMNKPEESMKALFKWLGLEEHKIDFNNIPQTTKESDSYYRMKYPHTVRKKLEEPKTIDYSKISPRILNTILEKYDWFYKQYYPEYFQNQEQANIQAGPNTKLEIKENLEEQVSKEIEEALEETGKKRGAEKNKTKK
jgi:sulfotransferase